MVFGLISSLRDTTQVTPEKYIKTVQQIGRQTQQQINIEDFLKLDPREEEYLWANRGALLDLEVRTLLAVYHAAFCVYVCNNPSQLYSTDYGTRKCGEWWLEFFYSRVDDMCFAARNTLFLHLGARILSKGYNGVRGLLGVPTASQKVRDLAEKIFYEIHDDRNLTQDNLIAKVGAVYNKYQRQIESQEIQEYCSNAHATVGYW